MGFGAVAARGPRGLSG